MPAIPPGRTRERVFAFVRGRLLAGRPPTVRDVQQAMGFRAVGSAREHLDALVAQGRLLKDAGRARGLRLPAGKDAPPPVLVPLLGRVAAGALTEAVEVAEGFVPVAARRGSDELFALAVKGDSMKDAAILDGDVVIVRRAATAADGRIVVARVGGEAGVVEATVKRLRIRRGRVELHPENPDFEPIVPAPGEVEILGVVVEVRRSLPEGRR